MSPEDVHIRVLRLGHAIQAGFRVGILGLRACPSILPNTWTHTHTHRKWGKSDMLSLQVDFYQPLPCFKWREWPRRPEDVREPCPQKHPFHVPHLGHHFKLKVHTKLVYVGFVI